VIVAALISASADAGEGELLAVVVESAGWCRYRPTRRTPLIMTIKGVRVAFLTRTPITDGIPSLSGGDISRWNAVLLMLHFKVVQEAPAVLGDAEEVDPGPVGAAGSAGGLAVHGHGR